MSKFLLTITGPSGSGKTTMMKELENKFNVHRIITSTTRQPRKGEKDGRDYYFMNMDDYCTSTMIAPVCFSGNYYGIDVNMLDKQLAEHDVCAIIVEPQGAKMLRESAGFIRANGVTVKSLYIDTDPKFALNHMARRDGFKKARERQKADFDSGMYVDGLFEVIKDYDCILKNDRNTTPAKLAYDAACFIEAIIMESKIAKKVA